MQSTAKPISIDTNIIIRLCIPENQSQTESANQLLDSYTKISIADTAIIEAVFVLTRHYGLSRDRACTTLNALILHPHINCNRELFDKAFTIYREHPSLSFEDCCLAIYAQLNNAAPLFTFDKKLANQLPQTSLLC